MQFYQLIARTTIRGVLIVPSFLHGNQVYDADTFIALIPNPQEKIVILPRKNHRVQRFYETERDTHRSQVERLFGRMK